MTGFLKKLCCGYLRGIDALVRLCGACIITGLLCGGLWLLCQGLIRLPFGHGVFDMLWPWIVLAFLPVAVRFGILGGGFSIPPLLAGKESGVAKAEDVAGCLKH